MTEGYEIADKIAREHAVKIAGSVINRNGAHTIAEIRTAILEGMAQLVAEMQGDAA